MPQNTSDNKFGVAKWIVDPTLANGTHTTIAGALASASSGDTIFVRPGTYTENLTLKAGVNITSFTGESGGHGSFFSTFQVKVIGKLTATFAGSCTISNLCLQTNGDYAIEVTGSSATNLYFNSCYLIGADFSVIHTTSSGNPEILLYDCQGDITVNNRTYIICDAAAIFNCYYCFFANSGHSTIQSTFVDAAFFALHCTLAMHFSLTSSGGIVLNHTDVNPNLNTVAITTTGVATLQAYNTNIFVNAIECISVGNTAALCNVLLSSNSATTSVSGAGTLVYSNVSFLGQTNITCTTQTNVSSGPSAIFTRSTAASTTLFTVSQTDNTSASSTAQVAITTGGASAGDATTKWSTTTTSWIAGVDNSVTSPTADPFVIAQGTALGTNNIMSVATSGEINYPLQPSFMAYLSSTQNDKTGNNAAYTLGTNTLTEVFDQNSDFNTNGTFTAPVTGRYFINSNVILNGCTIATTSFLTFITSNRNYVNYFQRAAGNQLLSNTMCVLADFDAADTWTSTITAQGEAGNTDDVQGGSDLYTFMSGYLVC